MDPSPENAQFFQQFAAENVRPDQHRVPAHEHLGALVLEKSYGPKGSDITFLVVGLVFIALAITNFIVNPGDWKVVIVPIQ